jgi:hypothetical protein
MTAQSKDVWREDMAAQSQNGPEHASDEAATSTVEPSEKKRRWRAPTVLHERHDEDCRCSYCGTGSFGPRPMRLGLNIPRAWRSPVSWWVIKYGRGRYVRWTWPRLQRAQPKPMSGNTDHIRASSGSKSS